MVRAAGAAGRSRPKRPTTGPRARIGATAQTKEARNFAGILIVWDRWFGSFEPEGERPLYGLTKNIDTHNPLRVAFHEYAAIARDLRSARSARAWLGYLFGHPGWRPAAAGTLDAPEQPVQGLFTGRP